MEGGPLIKVLLSGGLGNQLFQAAAAKKLAPGKAIFLLPSLGHAVLNESRNPEICDFKIDDLNIHVLNRDFSKIERRIANIILRMSSVDSGRSLKLLLATSLKKFSQIALGLLINENIQSPQGLGFDANFSLKPSTTLLIGNFHTYRMVDQDFLSGLTLRHSASKVFTRNLEILENRLVTGIHVRLGDYLNIEELNVLTPTYYTNAISNIERTERDGTYFIFTNDENRAKSYLPESISNKAHYVESSLSSAETIVLMSKCSNLISANSTFSWWGAIASDWELKSIYVPLRWFKSRSNPNEMCPPSWIPIKNE